MTDQQLFREYYFPSDPIRRPAETEKLRAEIQRRVAVYKPPGGTP